MLDNRFDDAPFAHWKLTQSRRDAAGDRPKGTHFQRPSDVAESAKRASAEDELSAS